ncbi:MAG: chromosome partitioning protein, partial [Actinomycetota bacterium]|nr:chromosome partitioning protein [Actinomycetota bacterium]
DTPTPDLDETAFYPPAACAPEAPPLGESHAAAEPVAPQPIPGPVMAAPPRVAEPASEAMLGLGTEIPEWAIPVAATPPAQTRESPADTAHSVPTGPSPAAAALPSRTHDQWQQREPQDAQPKAQHHSAPSNPVSAGVGGPAAQQQPYSPPAEHFPAPGQQQPGWRPQIPPPVVAPQAPPSLSDLRASRPDAPEPPAATGWRGNLRRLSGGLVKLAPNDDELRLRHARSAVQRSLRGPRTVVIINTKGGGGKTTAVYSLAATFGQARGGYILGWDNNETRGTLAWRAAPARHTNTAVDLLRDLERFEDPRNARIGDLDNYVRAQGSAQFDVLASDENAASAASIDDQAFRALHQSLSRFYRLLIVDTGNNVKAPNWQAAIDLADQIVIVSSIREDTAGGASWTLDHLAETGYADKVRGAVTILSAPKATADPDQRAMHNRFHEHFAARTRMVLDVPFDPALVDGDSIVYDALSPATRQAWLHAAAAIAEGL